MSRSQAWRLIVLTAALLVLAAHPGFAAESSEGGWTNRQLWDVAWRWINFAIVVFFLYKVAKDPLVNFLSSQKKEQAVRFEDLKQEEQDLERQHTEQSEQLAQMDQRIEDIKAYYRQVGEEEKERIKADAEYMKEQLLQNAREKAMAEFEKARKSFRAEVVEQAVRLAEQRIKTQIEAEDQDRLVQSYLGNLAELAESSAQQG
jgi:F-type H+-transporting ATPase subunit b